MPFFLNVPEARTCRYDSLITSAEIEGLYTDNFSECNIVIFYKQHGSHIRVSMTHADRYVTFGQIEQERIWIGDNAKALVVAKDTVNSSSIRQQVLGHLLKEFEVMLCDLNTFALSFSKGGLCYYTRDNVPALATHPLEWKLHGTYMLNIMFVRNASELKNTGLLYNVDRWSSLFQIDLELSCAAKRFYNQFSLELTKYSIISKITANQITDEILKANHIEAHQYNKVEIAWRSLLLFTENNYQAIYTAQLQHVLSLKDHMNADQLTFVNKLLQHTQANFEQFPRFALEVDQLPSNVACSLRGIYKLCTRAKHHDAPFGTEPSVEPLNESDPEKQGYPITSGLFGRNSVPWCAPPPGSFIDNKGSTFVLV